MCVMWGTRPRALGGNLTSYRWTIHRVYDAAGNDTSGRAALSMWSLARAAAEETLQGSPMTSAWLKLFRSHLSGNDLYWFRWSEDLAQSAELRRAYSGLYGRFVARALLSSHLGINRFISLKRNGVVIPGSATVTRLSKGDIPDWIAWDEHNARHVLCEAKGSLTSRDFLGAAIPKCVKEGKAQFDRVYAMGPTGALHPACWVAATRWVTDHRGGDPVTLLWDPPQDHRPFTSDEAAAHRQAMTRAWLDSIAPGFGWRKADDLISPERKRAAIMVSAEPGPIPPDQDWPELVDEEAGYDLSLGPRVQVQDHPTSESQQSDATLVFAELDSTLWQTPSYPVSWLGRPTQGEASPHQGEYLAAFATPLGVRPIHTRPDFEALKRAQERAQKLEEPAMMIGLPLDMDLAAPVTQNLWLDGAGIARKQDLAIFDLRRVDIELLDTSLAD